MNLLTKISLTVVLLLWGGVYRFCVLDNRMIVSAFFAWRMIIIGKKLLDDLSIKFLENVKALSKRSHFNFSITGVDLLCEMEREGKNDYGFTINNGKVESLTDKDRRIYRAVKEFSSNGCY